MGMSECLLYHPERWLCTVIIIEPWYIMLWLTVECRVGCDLNKITCLFIGVCVCVCVCVCEYGHLTSLDAILASSMYKYSLHVRRNGVYKFYLWW